MTTNHDLYLDYCRACRSVGTTPLSEDMWRRALTKPIIHPIDDTQFDYDTERREGWANGE